MLASNVAHNGVALHHIDVLILEPGALGAWIVLKVGLHCGVIDGEVVECDVQSGQSQADGLTAA